MKKRDGRRKVPDRNNKSLVLGKIVIKGPTKRGHRKRIDINKVKISPRFVFSFSLVMIYLRDR